jgi:uncharacterized protein YjeT (DUF2065 family)
MSDFLTALGLLFVLEGLIYGGAPDMAKRVAVEVQQLPESTLRIVGFACMALGLGIVWLVRG